MHARPALLAALSLAALAACERSPSAPLQRDEAIVAATNKSPVGLLPLDTQNQYPNVGLLIFDVGGAPAWRCSGTLIAPRVVLTAGHCTSGATGGRIWFDQNVEAGRPANGYPFGGPASYEFASVSTHPSYVDGNFAAYDVGVVILDEAPPSSLNTFPQLATANSLDLLAIRRGLQDQSFTMAGYGVSRIQPERVSLLARHYGVMQLIGTSSALSGAESSIILTDNPGRGTGGGGICFGDSGGPIFYKGKIAAINSFAMNSNCVGVAGGYRIDKADDLAFIGKFLN